MRSPGSQPPSPASAAEKRRWIRSIQRPMRPSERSASSPPHESVMRRTFAARSHASVVCAPDVADTTTHSVADAATSAPRYAACSCAPTVTAVFVPTCLARSVARATSPAARPAGSRIIIAYATADERTHVAQRNLAAGACAAATGARRRRSSSAATSSTRMSGIHGPARRNTEATRGGSGPMHQVRDEPEARSSEERRGRTSRAGPGSRAGRSGLGGPVGERAAAAPRRDGTPRRTGRRSRPTAR